MINYSVFCNEFIFEGWEEFEPEYDIIELRNGLKLQVEKVNDKQVRINQIISSNPRDFLNKDISPGIILNLSFV